MRILNLLNLDDEMVQATILDEDTDGINIATFATIDDLRDMIAKNVKGYTNNDYRAAIGGSHGIFTGYFPFDPRYNSRH